MLKPSLLHPLTRIRNDVSGSDSQGQRGGGLYVMHIDNFIGDALESLHKTTR